MIDAAKWFAKGRILGVWKARTEIHLILRRYVPLQEGAVARS